MKLADALERAWQARSTLRAVLEREDTNAWRWLHGSSEGVEGLTVDVYGAVLLVQSFRDALTSAELATIEALARERLPHLLGWVWNHRGQQRLGAESSAAVLEPLWVRELGVDLAFRARHRGLDPWLFLDLRAARRRIAQAARGKRLLNLFAYTCGAGVVAAAKGAREVWNVDFAQSHLQVGQHSAAQNSIEASRLRFLHEDALPILRQLAGLPIKGRASSRPYLRVEAQTFECVLLDPPAWSKGPFGAVDVARDYPSLLKPALLATAAGGELYATYHLPDLDAEGFRQRVERTAEKAGIALSAVEVFAPDADFPPRSASSLLKIVRCQRA